MGAKIIEDSVIIVVTILATSGVVCAGMVMSVLACVPLRSLIIGWLNSMCMTFCREAYKQYRFRLLLERTAAGLIKPRIFIGECANQREVT